MNSQIIEILKSGGVLEDLDKLPEEEAIKELTKIKGIGRWTAEIFLVFLSG